MVKSLSDAECSLDPYPARAEPVGVEEKIVPLLIVDSTVREKAIAYRRGLTTDGVPSATTLTSTQTTIPCYAKFAV